MAAMAEEVNYASVVFKSNNGAPPQAKKEEEIVYDEVKVKSQTTEQTADTKYEKENKKRRHCQKLACCLGILCIIMLFGLIGVFVYLATLSRDIAELKQFKEIKTTLLADIRNLTNLNNNLSLDNGNLRMERNNLTVQLGNLTNNYTVLESSITNLTTKNQELEEKNQELEEKNQELKNQNQELENQRNNLTEQIQIMETNWNELNVSRAQWSIDTYCPKDRNGVRTCKACQDGWLLRKTNCYVYHDAEPPEQKTWVEARDNCRGKSSHLAVIHTEEEKSIINGLSLGATEKVGYWIGLRVEERRWKWIDGTELNQTSWIGDPTEGHCAASVNKGKWRSVMCNVIQRWICVQEALSV